MKWYGMVWYGRAVVRELGWMARKVDDGGKGWCCGEFLVLIFGGDGRMVYVAFL